MKKKLSQLATKIREDKKNMLLVIVLTGILLLVIVWPADNGKSNKNQTMPDVMGSQTGGAAQGTDIDGQQDLAAASGEQSLQEYIARQEERLKEVLSAVDGAGQVQVMITAKASRERVVEKDVVKSSTNVTETDSAGGKRVSSENSYSESTLYENGRTSSAGLDGGQINSPYVIKELEPEIEGVVVVTQGGDDLLVVNEITESVSVLFNLPVHKIKVVKMES